MDFHQILEENSYFYLLIYLFCFKYEQFEYTDIKLICRNFIRPNVLTKDTRQLPPHSPPPTPTPLQKRYA